MSNYIQKTINKKLLGIFQKINHISYNDSYYGYSYKFSKKIFIKVFKEKNIFKFNREKEIQIKYTNLYVYDFEILKNKILVLEYKEYFDMNELNELNISEIASKIAKFHNSKIYDETTNNDLGNKILQTLEKLKIRKEYSYFKNIVEEFENFFEKIKIENEVIGKVNIHGDFSTRNIKFCNGKLELIDFERSKMNNYYLDFIKFFYIDLKSNKEKINLFLSEYYKKSKQKNISESLRYALILYTALGIMKYTSDIKNDEFEKIGFLMLNDVEKFIYEYKKNRNRYKIYF